jgi:hypothetical protein
MKDNNANQVLINQNRINLHMTMLLIVSIPELINGLVIIFG